MDILEWKLDLELQTLSHIIFWTSQFTIPNLTSFIIFEALLNSVNNFKHESQFCFHYKDCITAVMFSIPFPSLPFPSLPFPSLPFPSLPFPSLPLPSLPFPSLPFPSHPIPSHPIPSHPIPSHPIPSHPIPSHPIPSHPIPSHPIPSHPIPSHIFLTPTSLTSDKNNTYTMLNGSSMDFSNNSKSKWRDLLFSAVLANEATPSEVKRP